MMYGSWDMEYNRQNSCHFGPFLPFHPTNKLKNQNFEKMKKTLRYHHFTLVYNKWQSYDVQLLRYGAQQIEFFVILKKKWKKTLEISSFHTCVTQMTIIWCTASEIWKKTDIIFCHFEPVFAILPPSQPRKSRKSKLWKNEKNTWRYHFTT